MEADEESERLRMEEAKVSVQCSPSFIGHHLLNVDAFLKLVSSVSACIRKNLEDEYSNAPEQCLVARKCVPKTQQIVFNQV